MSGLRLGRTATKVYPDGHLAEQGIVASLCPGSHVIREIISELSAHLPVNQGLSQATVLIEIDEYLSVSAV